jgi:hypothetical protein
MEHSPYHRRSSGLELLAIYGLKLILIAGRPFTKLSYHHRRSSDLDPDKVVFWVMVLLFLIAAAV